ncbi:MAG: asparagine synthase (glutamine-hydrolyzing) [Burkholderiaceae bacterium]
MCGIVGVWGAMPHRETQVRNACGRLAHRGPDSNGLWTDTSAGITLGHVRLAILDLTPAGHQPMVSACGRYVLVLNGEIYNHQALRNQLEADGAAPPWRGHSDTETVLAALAAWGVEKTLRALVGMFAMGLWDRQDGTLTLMRDRLGEKPLYVGIVSGNLLFASELKAFQGMQGISLQISRPAVALLLRHNYIPAPHSIYSGLGKLAPGSYVTVSRAQLESGKLPEVTVYWSAQAARDDGRGHPLHFASDAHAIDALEQVLSGAVAGQMLADVPLGAFLSGGVDSSVIVALMQKASARPVRTFSIGFDEPDFDEAPYAKSVARHLGTDHTEHYVTAADALNVAPDLARLYDEPFADASQLPTVLVTRMARRNVTVALSGDGGDELFGGYSRYQWMNRWWGYRERIPEPLRPVAAWGAQALGKVAGGGKLQSRAAKVAELLAADSPGHFYQAFVSYWPNPEQLLPGVVVPPTPFDAPSADGFPEQMMLLDLQTYLPDDILVKVDRAAMACSLETRVPLLDHRVVEFAQQLPLSYKWRDGRSKWLLRQLLYRHVPAELVDRPKRGFSVPLGTWLRGPLRDWAHDLLDPARLAQQGIFRPEPVQARWRAHCQGRQDWSPYLWGVLMFQAWYDQAASVAGGRDGAP